MRPFKFLSLAMLAAVLVIGLGGCQQLFTTSLGKSLARSTSVPSNLTPDQAAALVAQATANQDPALATALVSSLLTQISTTTDPTTKAALESSAASAAIVASGIGSALTDLLASGTVSTDPATLTNLLATVQAGATPSVVTALSLLSDPAVVASPASSGLGTTDLVIAAVVVAASVIPPGTDPQTFDPTTLSSPTDQAAFTTAQSILTTAMTLPADSTTQSLINQVAGSFSLPSIP